MTLTEIHARTGLPLSQLRYVLDNALVPGIKAASSGRGTARDFRPGVAVLVALAAAMVGNHLRAPFVGRFVAMLAQDKSLLALERPGAPEEGLVLELAAPSYIRVQRPGQVAAVQRPRWFDLRTRAQLDTSFRPVILIAIDFGVLRGQILAGRLANS